ncbi:Putative ribose-phosphate pyrophosphokinase [Paenibacillus plantiphilus]|uniref:Ribose-phosphate pyrophosphokinase n=1 Tax=Paenibacillus plantiphilus TaxID=2905650 RepID=A0ABN8GSJ2_9BACL|nr:ribose-phosphate pyrophosphokinase [Paenibacillus plantiphilus]CAH1210725.1 Putative ribose-phosphate pyrophosphokinase [Paenibacillus plantiphilus]
MIWLNETKLENKLFPNGETLVNGEQMLQAAVDGPNTVAFKYRHDGDLIGLMFVKRFLDDHGFRARLVIYYMPYSRMDRVEGSSVFTLKYVADFINTLQFDTVTVIEPHSDVTLALLNKSRAVYPSVELLERVAAEVNFNLEEDYLFFPDAGAQKRYSKVKGYKGLVGFKVRDFQTGQIMQLDIVGKVDDSKKGFKAIIVDDLCSYGGTFLMSAEKLKEIGAAQIYLLVGHCENSIYEGKLLNADFIDRVFTTDSILEQPEPGTESEHDVIKVFPLGGY